MTQKPPLPPELPQPDEVPLPPDIRHAAKTGRLTLFIGNGVSRLLGIPSWDELANRMLKKLAKCGEIDHNQLEILSKKPTKMKISIANNYFKKNIKANNTEINYRSVLLEDTTNQKMQKNRIYQMIAECKSKFITTNYDPFLSNALRDIGLGEDIPKSLNIRDIKKESAQEQKERTEIKTENKKKIYYL